jgi:hypothetical protein
VDLNEILDRLREAGISTWLDPAGKLRITPEAPPELKELARQHKQELTDFHKAHALMKSAQVRIVRLPLGEAALSYPWGANREEIRWAARILGAGALPVVLADEGLRWVRYDDWRHRRETS